MKVTWNVIFLIAISSLFFLPGCGGGGGEGGGSSATDSQINQSDQAGQSINPGLAGKVVLGGKGWVLDLTTGSYTRVPGVEAWDERPEYLGIATVEITSQAVAGGMVVETVNNCRDSDSVYYNLECVRLYDGSGAMFAGFTFSGTIHEPVKISRDSRYLAVIREYDFNSSDYYLEIHDRENNQLVSYTVISQGFALIDFDWLPDNRLVYTLGQSIYVTPVLSTVGNPIIQFDSTQGEPVEVRASPDGERIAFVLKTYGTRVSTHGHAHTLDVNGNDLKRLAVVPGESDPHMKHPTWSPDGEWILLLEGEVGAADWFALGTPGTLYAVPADGTDVPLSMDTATTTAVPILGRHLQIHETDSDLIYRFTDAGELFWISSP
ncbi:MAG: hypothetical protein B6D72_07835 [gamma proteobacterium symbiont of Ctena orbiculata]|nr:PD40 domain-containing protein [Candidatus Thiodiazotropha taylori]PUB87679.1 MAG: hypothetical protein DBP00_08485 [gamma proteobacterium symbiont of Ctena orbiculata]MBT2996348.1 PD40 domain-containing protein [Candidatus Thiodiazotropha taylori]MBT3000218.1 PD40 domain-containing protein [Candidatus Thiodiazotropha taylori]MBT3028185.1 PD40 domain-containing protein [Candidatus Thiodiazotropha taylori]